MHNYFHLLEFSKAGIMQTAIEYACRHLKRPFPREQLASSPKEVTEAADITVAMLADPAAAVAVATGPNGAVAGLKEGAQPQPACDPNPCPSTRPRP